MPPEKFLPIFALLCDRQGTILQVVRDDADSIAPGLRGRSWTAVLDGADFAQAVNFMGELAAQPFISGWEINTHVGDQIVPMHFAGGGVGDQLLIVGAPTWSQAIRVYQEERAKIDHEDAGYQQPFIIERLPKAGAQVEGDGALQEELARLTNERGNLQRELVKKNAELAEKQHFIQQLLNTTPHLLFTYDLLAGRVVFLNRFVESVLGFTAGELKDLEWEFFARLLHADDVSRVAEYHQRFQTGHAGEIVEIEYRLRDAGGQWHWIHSHDALLGRNASGLPQQILCSARDVTARKQALETLEKQNRALLALQATALDIGSDLRMSTLLRRIMDRAVELLDADRGGGIHLYDPDEHALRLVEASGINEDRIGSLTALNAGVAGRVFQTRQPLIVNDYTHWEGRAFVLVPSPPSAVMGVPLLVGEQAIGVLNVFANSQRRTFNQLDAQLAEMFAAQAMAAIRNARLYEQAQREIAEREQAEESLQESEKKFRSVIEQSHDGISMVDSSGTVIEWNSGAEKITGLPRSEVIGQSIWDVQFSVAPQEIRTPALRDQIKAVFEEFLQTRQIPRHSRFSESLLQRPDGTRVILQASVFSIETDGVFLVCSIMRDVTELKQAEAGLRKLSRAVEQSPSTVVITDTRGNIEYVNPRFVELTGYTAQEVIGKNPRLIKSGKHPLEFYQELWGTLLAGNEWRGEFINKNKAGKLYWEMAAISAIRNGDGVITHFVKVAEDITERVQAEAEVRQARDGFATLLTVSRNIASTLEIHSLLDLVLDQLASVVAYSVGALVTTAQGQVIQSTYRGPRQISEAFSSPLSLQTIPLLEQAVDTRSGFYIPDTRNDPELVATVSAAIRQPAEFVASLRSWLILPLTVQDHVLGLLLLAHTEPEYYDAQTRSLAQIFANQAAIAIENATLYQQASEAAAQAARLRLADDLHDSVTQTVYGVNLYADAARLALAAGRTDAAFRNLEELAGLARDAMAELRLLIFEMRPAALEKEGLVKALNLRLDAVEKRARIRTDFQVVEERRLPLEVEVELYWTALEALNNALKHAHATEVAVSLSFENGRTALAIRDNGVGFDSAPDRPKRRIGLRTIQERVERIGGHMILESVAGQGTTVRIEVDR